MIHEIKCFIFSKIFRLFLHFSNCQITITHFAVGSLLKQNTLVQVKVKGLLKACQHGGVETLMICTVLHQYIRYKSSDIDMTHKRFLC